MLPDSLGSSYSRYKKDTAIYATWLYTTAHDHGYRVPSSKPTDTIGAVRDAVPVSEMLNQASCLVARPRPRVEIPVYAEQAAERALEARRRYSATIQTLMTDATKDASHLHFIDVMARSLSLLQSANRASSTTAIKPDTSPERLHNLFANLNMEEVNESFEIRFNGAQAAIKDQKRPPADVDTNDHRARSSESELRMQIICFFHDQQEIKAYLKDVWGQYKAGVLDLCTAAMTTNAAVSLIEQAQNELADSAGLNPERSFEEFVSRISDWGSCCSAQPKPFIIGPHMFGTTLDYFVDLASFQTTYAYASLTQKTTAAAAPMQDFRVEIGQLLYSVDLGGSRTKLHQRLSHLILDTVISQVSILNVKNIGIGGAVDTISAALMTLNRQMVTAHTVFAASTLLLIQEVLGDDSVAADRELEAYARRTLDVLDITNPGRSAPSGDFWTESDVRRSSIIHAPCWFVLEWPIGAAKDEYYRHWLHYERSAPAPLNNKLISRLEDKKYLRKINPVYCGTLLFAMKLKFEAFAMAVANSHLGPMLFSYLYVTLHNEGFLHTRWPELDAFIHEHIGPLFYGSLPKDALSTKKRFLLRWGIPLGEYANWHAQINTQVQRLRKDAAAGKDPFETPPLRLKLSKVTRGPRCLEASKTSQAFNKWLEGGETLVRTLHAVDKELLKPMKGASPCDFSPVDLLKRLREHLPATLEATSLPYISLTRDCGSVMHQIVSSGRIDLSVFGRDKHMVKDPLCDWRWTPLLLTTLHLAKLRASETNTETSKKPKEKVRSAQLSELKVSGEYVRAFLREKGMTTEKGSTVEKDSKNGNGSTNETGTMDKTCTTDETSTTNETGTSNE